MGSVNAFTLNQKRNQLYDGKNWKRQCEAIPQIEEEEKEVPLQKANSFSQTGALKVQIPPITSAMRSDPPEIMIMSPTLKIEPNPEITLNSKKKQRDQDEESKSSSDVPSSPLSPRSQN